MPKYVVFYYDVHDVPRVMISEARDFNDLHNKLLLHNVTLSPPITHGWAGVVEYSAIVGLTHEKK